MRSGTAIAVVAVLAAVAGVVFVWGYGVFTEPRQLAEPVRLVIPKDVGLDRVARLLESAGAIDNRRIFVWGARLSGGERRIKAGEYVFSGAQSQQDILNSIVDGRVTERRVTVIEGMTVRQVAALLQRMEGLSGELGPLPKEGSLLPETYTYRHGTKRRRLVDMMKEEMQETLTRLWLGRQDGLPFTSPQEAVILASIVEREARLPEERRRIAGVFLNRLARGMPLQSDPTVIYDLSDGSGTLGRPLSRADLATPGPHNTYRFVGLPPGPICNPGVAALAAALNPEETRALYFVADGRGGHVFAETLSDHNRNVARWRRLRDKKGGGSSDRPGNAPVPKPR